MRTATAITAIVSMLCLHGCADQHASPQAERQTTQANEVPTKAEQTLPVWQPSIGQTPDLSQQAQIELANTYAHINSPDDNPTVWAIHGNSCSWYCGGEADNATASSTLPDQNEYTYTANNAHDLGLDTAWVEGVEGPGIGQTLTYTFTNKCPRITDILIHNGYIKDQATWRKNNRVRTLEIAINGKPTALLELADTRAKQSFDLQALGLKPLGRRADGQSLVLAFTIADVYPGTTYDDTAITEIYFDGIDVH